jgi:pantoate--beta-alanine ligase
MEISPSIEEARKSLARLRCEKKRVGLVPTMGALHEGHFSLVRSAKQQCDVVAVSLFVNPTQFGPQEDFSKYPRNFEHDCEMLQKEAVDLLFAPSAEEMYPKGTVSYVTVEGLSEKLCGKSRPGHFRGVTTVVAKLFHIVEPEVAFFGQKDAAQVAIIQRMVRDLNMRVKVVVCPIIREPDGLAMSSRNAYLDAEHRKAARVLYRSLLRAEELFKQGERNAAKLIAAGKEVFVEEPSVRLDYFEIVDPENLEAITHLSQKSLAAAAAFVGTTRLIDNLELDPWQQVGGALLP